MDLNVFGSDSAFPFLQFRDKPADEVLGPGIDVGAVKRGKAALHQHVEGAHDILHVQCAVQAVPEGQLPAAVDGTVDKITWREFIGLSLFHTDHPFCRKLLRWCTDCG